MSEEYIVIAELAEDCSSQSSAHSNVYPVLVGLGTKSGRVLIQQGSGHGLRGSVVSVNRFDVDKWRQQFEDWDCSWFLKLIQNSKLGINELVEKTKSKISELDIGPIKMISR